MGLIYLDACIVIYYVESHPRWADLVDRAIRSNNDATLSVSPLVKCEAIVGSIRRGDMVLQRAFGEFFACIATLDMPESVYLEASELRARFGLKTPDALHLACAQHHRCDALWTNDDRLTRVSRGLARNILSPT
jgi:predicted nucleic acid-binding protein